MKGAQRVLDRMGKESDAEKLQLPWWVPVACSHREHLAHTCISRSWDVEESACPPKVYIVALAVPQLSRTHN